ncbi:MAG: hypothetical protein IT372_30180 [Polyangiaceae bacterium]|nr:hypothetical protein [Polyangiaceae bacterium]
MSTMMRIAAPALALSIVAVLSAACGDDGGGGSTGTTTGTGQGGSEFGPPCAGDAECAGDPAWPHCNQGLGVCVECIDSSHCGNVAKPNCAHATICVQCNVNADCPSATPTCTSENTCI